MIKTLAVGGVEEVISGGYCIGCGGCSVIDPNIIIRENSTGAYEAISTKNLKPEANDVCPFSSPLDENQIGAQLYSSNRNHDSRVGYYNEIFAGHVTEGEFRVKGSSGGVVTWILEELLENGHIDAVIHVGELNKPGELFGYKISQSKEDIRSNSKSKYYPVHISEVMQLVKQKELRYAFVGIPCFIKSVRLLSLADPVISERIKFCIAIFCGHLKTKAFSEMIGWQQGVPPNKLGGIDFRVKTPNLPANLYSIQVAKVDEDEIQKLSPVQANKLYGMDWGLGYFKPKGCDWCDDIAGETADLACGDAWLKEFDSDPGGNNIMVVRNNIISEIIKTGIEQKKLNFQSQTVEKVYESQAGNYRHRQEGLSVRTINAREQNIWFPKKRFNEHSYVVPKIRAKIYLLRSRISHFSHINFLKSKNNKSYFYFVIKMAPLEIKYYCLTRGWLRGIKKGLGSFKLFKKQK